MLVPLLRIITEGSIPAPLRSPHIPNPDQPKLLLLELSYLYDAVVVVLKDPMGARIGVLGALTLHVIDAAQVEARVEGGHQ